MDQRISTGANGAFARPIHRACVVAGCWCGSTAAASRTPATDRLRRSGRTADLATATATYLTDIALRSVGLPVA